MMRKLILLSTALFITCTAAAQDYGQTATVKIWDNRTAPHSNSLTGPDEEKSPHRISNTTEATLYIFPADEATATGQGVVICPGGGYALLCMDYEGYQIAEWFAANGITAALLKYRLPNGHREVPLEDAVQAVRIMKGLEKGAGQYACAQVGIVGFSAGGHLAAYASTMGATRPDFSILFYPVITGTVSQTHKGTFDNLLGEGRTRTETATYSLENAVDAQTPPALLLVSYDDRTVPVTSSLRYVEALNNFGIPASIHVYPSGGHGWGIHDSFAYKAQWQDAVQDWVQKIRR